MKAQGVSWPNRQPAHAAQGLSFPAVLDRQQPVNLGPLFVRQLVIPTPQPCVQLGISPQLGTHIGQSQLSHVHPPVLKPHASTAPCDTSHSRAMQHAMARQWPQSYAADLASLGSS